MFQDAFFSSKDVRPMGKLVGYGVSGGSIINLSLFELLSNSVKWICGVWKTALKL